MGDTSNAPVVKCPTGEEEGCACVIAGRFAFQKRIGAGAFGIVSSALDLEKNEEVAVKVEQRGTGRKELLEWEYQIYKIMEGGVGIGSVRFFGQNPEHSVLVMDLHGPSLETLFTRSGRLFSIKTVLMLADQMISLLEGFHSKNFIHRDVKPDNFVMGKGDKGDGNTVYIIDFGLAKSYKSLLGFHFPLTPVKHMTGTARYMSINAHKFKEQSRRDDMEALGFVLLYFTRGNLPWQAITGEHKHAKIAEMKMATSLDSLTEGLPVEFKTYMEYCRSLGFKEAPDYAYLRLLFRHLLQSEHYYDHKWDWVEKKSLVCIKSKALIEKYWGVIVNANQGTKKKEEEKGPPEEGKV